MLELTDEDFMQLGRDAVLAEEGAAQVASAGPPAAGPLVSAAAAAAEAPAPAAAVAAVQQPSKPAQRQVWATMPSFGKPKAKTQLPAKAAPSGVAQEPSCRVTKTAFPAESRKSSLAAAIRSYAGGADGAASAAEASAGWRSSKAVRGTQDASPSQHDNRESSSQRSAAAQEQPAEAGAAEAAAAATAEDKGKGAAPPVSVTSVEEDTKALYAALFGMPLDLDDEAAASTGPSDAEALGAGPVDVAPYTAPLTVGASGMPASLMDVAVGSVPTELPSSSQATADTSVPVTAMCVAKFAASAQATTQTQDATEPLQQEQHAAEPLLHVQLATQVETCSVEQVPAGVLATQNPDQQPGGVRARAKRSLQETFRKR